MNSTNRYLNMDDTYCLEEGIDQFEREGASSNIGGHKVSEKSISDGLYKAMKSSRIFSKSCLPGSVQIRLVDCYGFFS